MDWEESGRLTVTVTRSISRYLSLRLVLSRVSNFFEGGAFSVRASLCLELMKHELSKRFHSPFLSPIPSK